MLRVHGGFRADCLITTPPIPSLCIHLVAAADTQNIDSADGGRHNWEGTKAAKEKGGLVARGKINHLARRLLRWEGSNVSGKWTTMNA